MHNNNFHMIIRSKKKCLFITFLIIFLLFELNAISAMSIAEKYYFDAADCYKKLKQDPDKQQFRHLWLECIEKSENVYKNDSEGRWATAGLYQTGLLYYKLYLKSYLKDDFIKAENNFKLLLKKFPESNYRTRSVNALLELQNKNPVLADFDSLCMCPKKKRSYDKKKDNEAKNRFFLAESCYSKLKNSKKSNENNWLSCIKKFYDVYKYDPEGRWAAAGLYQAGYLFYILYNKSHNKRHFIKAENYLKQTIKLYPISKYCQSSSKLLKNILLVNYNSRKNKGKSLLSKKNSFITKEKKSDERTSKANLDNSKHNHVKTKLAKQKYLETEENYKLLLKLESRNHNDWKKCIEQYYYVYEIDPKGPWAAAGLYRAARLSQEYYRLFRDNDYLKSAKKYFKKILEIYPSSSYVSETKKILKDIDLFLKTYPPETKENKPIEKPEIYEVIKKSEKINTASKKEIANIIGMRHKSIDQHTRVVVDIDKEIDFTHNLIKGKDFTKLKIDLNNVKLPLHAKEIVIINDGLIRNVIPTQLSQNSVRLMFELITYKNYKIFNLKNPDRIVIDVWADEIDNIDILKKDDNSENNNNNTSKTENNTDIAKQLALGVKRIAIDAGHGGKDGGAIGYDKNILEKDITLSIAKLLESKIKKCLHCEVILTRDTDFFLSLDERTAIANKKNVDLFISIHTNAHQDNEIYGIETYYLNLATDDDAIRVANRENAISGRNMSDLDAILHDLMRNTKINESSRLAAYVQKSICRNLQKQFNYINDHGVKQAPFYVLMGAQMPSILIETGFISNKREQNRLLNNNYLDELCESIINGIKEYILNTNPTAFQSDQYFKSKS